MVRTPAYSNGILFEGAQSRGRLTGVPKAAIASLQQRDYRRGHTGDAAEVREEVESNSLGAKDRIKRAFDACDDIAGRDAAAVGRLGSPPQLRVDLRERSLSEEKAGKHSFGLRGDYGSSALVRRHQGFGRYVVIGPIFREGGGDQIAN